MSDHLNPPALLRAAEDAESLIAEARAVDSEILLMHGRTVDAVRRRGELLLKAKSAAGHGNWLKLLAEKWPGLNERTARRYMEEAKSDNLSDLNAALRAVTHPTDDQDSGVTEVGDRTSDNPCVPCGANPSAAEASKPQSVSPPGQALPISSKGRTVASDKRTLERRPPMQPEIDFDPAATARAEAERTLARLKAEREAELRRSVAKCAEQAKAIRAAVPELLRGSTAAALSELAKANGIPLEAREHERMPFGVPFVEAKGQLEVVREVRWPAVEALDRIFAELSKRSKE